MSNSYFSYYNRDISMDKVLNLLKQAGIEDQSIVKAIVNAVFCKIPLYTSNISVISKVFRGAVDFINEETNAHAKTVAQEIMKALDDNRTSISSLQLQEIFSLLIELGADPNTTDENGNTALHHVTGLLLNTSHEKVLDICYKLKTHGIALNKKNCNQETPFFYLIELTKERERIPGIAQMVKICEFLLQDTTGVNEVLPNGLSVFHLIMHLFEMGLNLPDYDNKDIFLKDMIQLLQLLSVPKVKKGVTVNKVDDHSMSPLHYWASLPFPSVASKDTKVAYDNMLNTIFKHLLSCGAHLNIRNGDDETPLHLCKTWSAVKLLVEAGANTNDVDLKGRPPLLVSAQDQIFLQSPDCFYPDVTEDPQPFWRNTIDKGFELWACDKDANSIISHLIASEALALAKALVEVACDDSYHILNEALVGVLSAVCKDKSTRMNWKALLVEMILKVLSKRRLIDITGCLRLCCKNIQESADHTKAVNKREIQNEENEDVSNSKTTASVHWEIAKRLLFYGVCGESCLDLAYDCPELKDLLTKTPSIDEVPMVIPWTSFSTTYEKRLAEVARRQNCKIVEGTTYWHHNDHIASGTFGHVFAGINEKDGMEVAIKRIEKLRMVRPEDKREIRTFTALTTCKQIVHYLAFSEYQEFSYVALELMEGNLDDYFGSACYDPLQNITLSKDVVMGLKYLHHENILHRDLKPSNILYKTHPSLCLKIADFGLSLPMDMTLSATVRSTNAGTRGWIAREVVTSRNNAHSKSSDIFSCGLILHYIFSPQRHPFSPAVCAGKSVWQINTDTEHNVLYNKMEGWDSSLPSEVSNLVRRMLDSDESKRPSALDLLSHPMFWSNKKKMDFLSAVGDQPEFECPRRKRSSMSCSLVVENQVEASFSSIVKLGKWDDAGYKDMPTIYAEMTNPVVKTGKKGKTLRKYDTGSVVELVRFIRNATAHASDASPTPLFRKLVLSDSVFLTYYPNLVMEVYKAIIEHGWDARDQIKRMFENK